MEKKRKRVRGRLKALENLGQKKLLDKKRSIQMTETLVG